MESIGFNSQAVKRQVVNQETYLSPNARRLVFVPIQPITELNGKFFGFQRLNPNQFFPIYPVQYHETSATADREASARTPAEVVADLVLNAASESNPKFLVEFLKLAQIEDEDEQNRVLQVLSNPNTCKKYPFELRQLCSSCWLEYLMNEAPGKVSEHFGNNEQLFAAASDTLLKLVEAFQGSLSVANLEVNNALKQIDDKKAGKSSLYDSDYANIRHTHQNMPAFRTSTDTGNQMNELIGALKQFVPANNSTLSIDDVKSLIAEAVGKKDQEIENLKAQLGQTETVAKCGDTGGTNGKGEPCGNLAKINGRCASHPLEN